MSRASSQPRPMVAPSSSAPDGLGDHDVVARLLHLDERELRSEVVRDPGVRDVDLARAHLGAVQRPAEARVVVPAHRVGEPRRGRRRARSRSRRKRARHRRPACPAGSRPRSCRTATPGAAGPRPASGGRAAAPGPAGESSLTRTSVIGPSAGQTPRRPWPRASACAKLVEGDRAEPGQVHRADRPCGGRSDRGCRPRCTSRPSPRTTSRRAGRAGPRKALVSAPPS